MNMAARSGPRPVSVAEAVASVESGMRVRFVLGHTPMLVAEALAARAPELRERGNRAQRRRSLSVVRVRL